MRKLGGKLSLERQPANAFTLAVLLCLMALAAGCVISPRRIVGGGTPTPTPNPSGSPTPTPVPGAPGKLYVSDPNTNSILRFDNANIADGNLAPAATINGAATLLNSPQHIFVDSIRSTSPTRVMYWLSTVSAPRPGTQRPVLFPVLLPA